MSRYRLCRILLLSLFASVTVALPEQAAAQESTITFVGGGWGHGVGMSQYGAFARADDGQDAADILAFYYDGTELYDDDTETRIEAVDEALGGDIRVRLSPSAGATRPKGVTVTSDTEESLTITIGEQVLGPYDSLTIIQAVQTVESQNEDEDEWAWILHVDGDTETDVCEECRTRTPVVTWTEDATVSISDDVHGDQGTHDEGSLHVVGQDIAAVDGVLVVLHVPVDEYIAALAEMPSSWPAAALEAQAIAGRSYAIAKAFERSHLSFDVYDSVSDQVYGGLPAKEPGRRDAAAATSGQVLVYDDAVVRTFYSSSNGGYTSASEDSFTTPEPFHVAKADDFDAALDDEGDPRNPFPFREFAFTVSDVSRWLADYDPADLDVGTVRQIIVEDLPPSGRINDALVTVIGSERTLEVRRGKDDDGDGQPDGDPYGLRFYNAIKVGCEGDLPAGTKLPSPLCPVSSNFDVISFLDISTDDFFYTPVIWMAKERITTGKAPGLFAPNDPVTRAEAATFIWRFMGEIPPEEPSGFEDVPEGIWFDQAVTWMKEAGITTGTSPTMFSPDGVVTRGQLAAFLWRLAGEPLREVEETFDDVEAGRFYTDAVDWMVFHGITTGTSPTTFEPDAELTRGQLATFLWRLAGTPGAFAEDVDLPEKIRS